MHYKRETCKNSKQINTFKVAVADVMNINTIVIGNLRCSNVPILPLTG